MVNVERIAARQVDAVWPYIEEWVKNALGIDKSYTIQDIKKECENGCIGLLLISTNELKGFFTYTINNAPQGKTAYAPWLGGKDLGEWVAPAFAQFREYLKTQNCISFSWIGRKAWQRFLDVDSEQSFYLINL